MNIRFVLCIYERHFDDVQLEINKTRCVCVCDRKASMICVVVRAHMNQYKFL